MQEKEFLNFDSNFPFQKCKLPIKFRFEKCLKKLEEDNSKENVMDPSKFQKVWVDAMMKEERKEGKKEEGKGEHEGHEHHDHEGENHGHRKGNRK